MADEIFERDYAFVAFAHLLDANSAMRQALTALRSAKASTELILRVEEVNNRLTGIRVQHGKNLGWYA